MTALHGEGERDDHELVRRMLAHDNRAWRVFIARYERLIYGCIHRILSKFSSGTTVEAEEVYACLLSGLLRRDMHQIRAFEFERGNQLSTWLGLLATHAAWDHLRASVRRLQAMDMMEPDGVAAQEIDALRTLIAREDCSRVATTLDGMSMRDREFAELIYVKGDSPEEIAETMGISVKTVYTKKHKIRSRLVEKRGRTHAA